MRLDPESSESGMISQTVDFTGMKVIEIGTGDGRMTSLISTRAGSVLAIDTDEELIAKAGDLSGHDNVEYRVGDICSIRLEPGEFDAAVLALSL